MESNLGIKGGILGYLKTFLKGVSLLQLTTVYSWHYSEIATGSWACFFFLGPFSAAVRNGFVVSSSAGEGEQEWASCDLAPRVSGHESVPSHLSQCRGSLCHRIEGDGEEGHRDTVWEVGMCLCRYRWCLSLLTWVMTYLALLLRYYAWNALRDQRHASRYSV